MRACVLLETLETLQVRTQAGLATRAHHNELLKMTLYNNLNAAQSSRFRDTLCRAHQSNALYCTCRFGIS